MYHGKASPTCNIHLLDIHIPHVHSDKRKKSIQKKATKKPSGLECYSNKTLSLSMNYNPNGNNMNGCFKENYPDPQTAINTISHESSKITKKKKIWSKFTHSTKGHTFNFVTK